jgi:endogenous inhibitor of DNA gyrase (YacG/DUF329 family)
MTRQNPGGHCPICGKPNLDEKGRPMRFFPFCSPNCKLVDLENWLNGKYFEELVDPMTAEDPEETNAP